MHSGFALLEDRNQGDIELYIHKRYDKGFKAKVAMEVLQGEWAIQEIGKSFYR